MWPQAAFFFLCKDNNGNLMGPNGRTDTHRETHYRPPFLCMYAIDLLSISISKKIENQSQWLHRLAALVASFGDWPLWCRTACCCRLMLDIHCPLWIGDRWPIGPDDADDDDEAMRTLEYPALQNNTKQPHSHKIRAQIGCLGRNVIRATWANSLNGKYFILIVLEASGGGQQYRTKISSRKHCLDSWYDYESNIINPLYEHWSEILWTRIE